MLYIYTMAHIVECLAHTVGSGYFSGARRTFKDFNEHKVGARSACLTSQFEVLLVSQLLPLNPGGQEQMFPLELQVPG